MQYGRSLVVTLVVLAGVALSGCTPEKARALQRLAVQFKIESLAAIDAIDTMNQRELEPPTRSPTEVRSYFIESILNYPQTDKNGTARKLTPEIVDLALDSNQIHLNQQTQKNWQAFIAKLRNQYTTFASIFDQFNGGSLFNDAAVQNAGKEAKMLTLQMAYFSFCIDSNPPQLFQYRTDIIAKLDNLRKKYQENKNQLDTLTKNGATGDSIQRLQAENRDIENQTGLLMEQWQQVKTEEQKLLETTVAQTLKAAVLGEQLNQMINQYDKIDIGDLNSLISEILDTTSAITGRNYTSLKQKAAALVAEIQKDPKLSDISSIALADVNKAINNRSITTSTQSSDLQVNKCGVTMQ